MRTVDNNMNIHPIDGSTAMMITTTGLYVATVILNNIIGITSAFNSLLQSLAGIGAVLAGFSTLAYNCYRFYNDYKKNKKEKGGSV